MYTQTALLKRDEGGLYEISPQQSDAMPHFLMFHLLLAVCFACNKSLGGAPLSWLLLALSEMRTEFCDQASGKGPETYA